MYGGTTLVALVRYKRNVAAKPVSSKRLVINELWLLELRIKRTRILTCKPGALWDMFKSPAVRNYWKMEGNRSSVHQERRLYKSVWQHTVLFYLSRKKYIKSQIFSNVLSLCLTLCNIVAANQLYDNWLKVTWCTLKFAYTFILWR